MKMKENKCWETKKQAKYNIKLSQFIALRVFRLHCRKDKPRWNVADSQDWGDGVQPTKVATGGNGGSGGSPLSIKHHD